MFREKKLKNGHGRVALRGGLTIHHADRLKKRFDKYANGQICRSLMVDMAEVSAMDTACLQILISLKQTFIRSKRPLTVVNLSPAVIEVFDINNLGSFFGDTVLLNN